MVEVATGVFGSCGYYAASMDRIADEANISKPMLYAYFKSKEGLYSACMRNAGDALIETFRSSYDPDRTTEQQLWDGFLAYFTFVGEHADAWRLISFDAFPAIAEFRDIAIEIHKALRGEVEERVSLASTGTPADPFSDAVRRTALARAMFGAAESIALQWLASNDDSPQTPCHSLMNFFWVGLERISTGEVWSESAVARPS